MEQSAENKIDVATKKMDNSMRRFNMMQVDPNCPPCESTGRYIYSVFHSILALVAIYMSFRCNRKFEFGSFLLACCCPYIYIVYILATRGTCGILENPQFNL
jgi:hypothetical protein